MKLPKGLADMVQQAVDMVQEQTGAVRIVQERFRQVQEEGWTPEHDDKHDRCELTQAATCYAVFAVWQVLDPAGTAVVAGETPEEFNSDPAWPWDEVWWKPSADPVRNLEKAGALIAAEIDRLERAKKGTA